jgi:hypothetical protein
MGRDNLWCRRHQLVLSTPGTRLKLAVVPPGRDIGFWGLGYRHVSSNENNVACNVVQLAVRAGDRARRGSQILPWFHTPRLLK